MKKFQFVIAFKFLRELEICLDAQDVGAAKDVLAQLEEHLASIRNQWWNDNRRTFGAIRKLLGSFYRQAWSNKFKRTKRLEEALSFFANRFMDDLVLGGDPEQEPDDPEFTKQRRLKPHDTLGKLDSS